MDSSTTTPANVIATDPATIALIDAASRKREAYDKAVHTSKDARRRLAHSADELVHLAAEHRALTNSIRERDDRPNLFSPQCDEWTLSTEDTAHLHSPDIAAIATLEGLGYTHKGGVQWKPPLGKQPIPIHEAYNALKRELQENEGYAWTFLSNVAMPLKDACKFTDGAANTAAGILIRHLFDYDVTKHPAWDNHMARWASTVWANRDEQHEKNLRRAEALKTLSDGRVIAEPAVAEQESVERDALRDTLMQIAMPEVAARVASDPDRVHQIAEAMVKAIDAMTGIPEATGPSQQVRVDARMIANAARDGVTDGGRNEAFEGLHEGETLRDRAVRLYWQGWTIDKINETERNLKQTSAEVSGKSLQVEPTVAEAIVAELDAVLKMTEMFGTSSRVDVHNRLRAVRELIAPAAPDLSPEYVAALKASKREDFQQEFTVHFDRAESHPRIEPTVGRRVWFRINGATMPMPFLVIGGDAPFDAGVAFVWKGGEEVNLDVCDHAGRHHAFNRVKLLQPGEAPPAQGCYAEWMPFQIKTAGKA